MIQKKNILFSMENKQEILDGTDIQILERLQRNARATWAELSNEIGLTAPAIAERTRKLEERGMITGYHAQLEPERIGCGLLAYIAVQLRHPNARQPFLDRIQTMPEILECHHMTGEDDYWLKVRCASTTALERIIGQEFQTHEGFKTRTTIVLSSPKDTPNLPL
jgi:Lrp/AsnC family transcriptional regulator, leucine-responsive regulatory protein